MSPKETGENLHEISYLIFWGKYENYFKMLSADFLSSMLSVNNTHRKTTNDDNDGDDDNDDIDLKYKI